MTRVPVSAGNWKMNPAPPDLEPLVSALRASLASITGVERVICPPTIYLERVAGSLKGSGISIGAQNVHWEDKGAFTGELSPAMLSGIAEYVIIGHSERRALFGESDQSVNQRTAAALRHGLRPIVCVGETLDQRKAGATGAVLERQMQAALAGLTLPDGFIIAYEPVWAIGTGRAATPTLAAEAASFIRQQIARAGGPVRAAGARILYGGSVTAANVAEFMAEPEIDGALVGGASLKASEFTDITRAIAAARA